MATPPVYNYVVQQGPGVRARLSLNEVPFHHEKPADFDGISALASHLLVPGENVFTLEILEAPNGGPGCFVKIMITKEVAPKEPTETVFELHWPTVWQPLDADQRTLPFVHRAKFDVDQEHPAPPWLSATAGEVPPEGTPELHQAVLAVVEAFRRGDGPGFVDAMGDKVSDMGRYYPPNDGISRGALTRKYEAVLAQQWDVSPFEREQYVFEGRRSGRLAYVTRADGKRALDAQNLEDPEQSMRSDLVLMRTDKGWRVIR